MHFKLIVSCLIILTTLIGCYCKSTSNKTIDPPLTIGSFNVQKLGNSKLSNSKIMNIVKQICLMYDLVLIQEIVTLDESLMQGLVKDLNKLTTPENEYSMVISERLGRDRAKEQYAFLYKSNKLRVLKEEVYPDVYDDFMRPPFIVHFATPTLRDVKSFLAIGIHTQPKSATNETSALANVYDYANEKYREKNAILLGDMNAGCQNVRIGDWQHIDLWTREEFVWLITHDIDTTVSSNCCPYDRMVVAGAEMSEAIIWNSIHVFNFKNAYGLTTEEALNISDHWPIGVKLRGKVSDNVSEHVSSSICLTVEDSRQKSLPAEIQRQKTTMGFSIERSDGSTTLTKTSAAADLLLTDFEKLSSRFPDFISKELLETTIYKIQHEALHDKSSFSLTEEFFSLIIDFDQIVTIHFCSKTSNN